MRRAPLLLPALAFLAGIVAEAHEYGAAASCVAILLALFRQEVAVGCLCGVLLGMLFGHPARVIREFPTARYAGSVVSDVRFADGTREFAIAIDGLGTLRAIAHEPVYAGERLAVRGRISPIDQARNPGEPSPQAIALDDGVIGELAIQKILTRRPPDLHDLRIWPGVLREHLSQLVRSSIPEPEATILAGALFGERGSLPQNIRDDFQATGTVHILITAGLHLGVVAALAGVCFALLQLPRCASSIATIPVVFAYAWLTGWHLPSQRAAVMLSIALIARACGARAISVNTLAIAAIVVAAWRPVAVQSVSFALSFSCVTAIVLFAEPIAERLAAARFPKGIAEALALTLSTQIGVWPLIAATFFSLAPYAVIANAVVVPLVSVTMVVGLAAVAAHPIAAVGTLFARWDTWLLWIVLLTTHGIAALPGARLQMTPPPMWSIVTYDLILAGAAALMKRRPMYAVFAVVFACVVVARSAAIQPTGKFSIIALDVGQGDALIIRTPHGRTIMIDTGGRLERGPVIEGRSPAERSADRIVLPYLQRAGITAIDVLVLTHPHGDHVGGCLGIVTQVRVREIFDSGQSYGGRAYADCKRAATERRVPIRIVRRGLRWSTDDGVSLDILAPTNSPLVDTGDDVNENSIVARLTYAREGQPFTALFMGDAGMARESEMIEHHIALRADLLKVGHHGSGYASTPAFIDAVKPRFATISVGRHNLFGHPASATIDTLRRAGAALMRTDQCGAVTLAIGASGATSINTMMPCAWVPRPHR